MERADTGHCSIQFSQPVQSPLSTLGRKQIRLRKRAELPVGFSVMCFTDGGSLKLGIGVCSPRIVTNHYLFWV
jgi:hypothetical protein